MIFTVINNELYCYYGLTFIGNNKFKKAQQAIFTADILLCREKHRWLRSTQDSH